MGRNSAPILVISKEQPTNSGSSTESEKKGYNFACCVIERIHNTMEYINNSQSSNGDIEYVYLQKELNPSVIEVDNNPAMTAVGR